MHNQQTQHGFRDTTQQGTAVAAQPKADPFFTPIGNTKPYFKAAFEGFAGAGKTYTAALVAIGLHKRIGSQKPIVIFDTERAAKFLKPLFAQHGIEALIRESKSLADLKLTMQKMRHEAISDILIIDSISHVWEGFLKAYQEKVRRSSLQFQDWGVIKPTWKAEFSEPFVDDPYHAIMCGRAGYEYENEINPDTGRREIFKSGVKMKVEGETAYEPDMLVLMNRFEEVIGKDKKVWREATVIKDRSTLLDGKTFQNPTYDHFMPAIEALLENPVPRNAQVAPEADTVLLFRTEEEKFEWRKERDRWMEEIEGLLTRVAPAATGKDKQLKLELLDKIFGTTSETAIRDLMPEQLKEGFKQLCDAVVELGLAQYITRDNGQRALAFARKPEGSGNGDEAKKPAEAKKEAEKKK